MLTSILSLILSAVILSPPLFAENYNHTYIILKASDPAEDQELTCQPDQPYPGGDIHGAELILRKVPVSRGEETKESRPEYIYLPVELTIEIDSSLEEGEVQLCIFIHLPPIQLEHIISRDSFLTGTPPGEERIVLTTQSEVSLFTGMETIWDEEVLRFKESSSYRNCYFDSPPGKRTQAIREAKQFNIHKSATYHFPPSPTFYWGKIPPLTISTSLVVRELDNLTVRGIRELLNDTMEASWIEVTEISEEIFDLTKPATF